MTITTELSAEEEEAATYLAKRYSSENPSDPITPEDYINRVFSHSLKQVKQESEAFITTVDLSAAFKNADAKTKEDVQILLGLKQAPESEAEVIQP